jgi:hypothetical protein
MRRLEQRINKVEAAKKQRAGDLSSLTCEELNQRLGVILARMGTSREKVIAEFGSLEGYADVIRQKKTGG